MTRSRLPTARLSSRTLAKCEVRENRPLDYVFQQGVRIGAQAAPFSGRRPQRTINDNLGLENPRNPQPSSSASHRQKVMNPTRGRRRHGHVGQSRAGVEGRDRCGHHKRLGHQVGLLLGLLTISAGVRTSNILRSKTAKSAPIGANLSTLSLSVGRSISIYTRRINRRVHVHEVSGDPFPARFGVHSPPKTSSRADGPGFGPTRFAEPSSGWSTSLGVPSVVLADKVLVGLLRTDISRKMFLLTSTSNPLVMPLRILERRGEHRHKARAAAVPCPVESLGWGRLGGDT